MHDDIRESSPPRRNLHWLLYGNDGLRAIWSIVLFAAIMALCSFGVRAGMHHMPTAIKPYLHMDKEMPPWVVLLQDGIGIVLTFLAAWIVSRVEPRPFGRYGVDALRSHRLRQFAVGGGWGLLLLTVLVVVLHISGFLTWNGILLHGTSALTWGFIWAVAFFTVGLLEEFLMRGFLQFTLARGIAAIARALGRSDQWARIFGFWAAAVFFSLLFGLGHKGNAGESPIGLLSAGLIGLVFAFSLWRTGSLWWAIGFHTAWDWAQSFVWGVADSGGVSQHRLLSTQPQGPVLMSGGLTGPEGSILVLPIVAITALVIALTLKQEPNSPAAEANLP